MMGRGGIVGGGSCGWCGGMLRGAAIGAGGRSRTRGRGSWRRKAGKGRRNGEGPVGACKRGDIGQGSR